MKTTQVAIYIELRRLKRKDRKCDHCGLRATWDLRWSPLETGDLDWEYCCDTCSNSRLKNLTAELPLCPYCTRLLEDCACGYAASLIRAARKPARYELPICREDSPSVKAYPGGQFESNRRRH